MFPEVPAAPSSQQPVPSPSKTLLAVPKAAQPSVSPLGSPSPGAESASPAAPCHRPHLLPSPTSAGVPYICWHRPHLLASLTSPGIAHICRHCPHLLASATSPGITHHPCLPDARNFKPVFLAGELCAHGRGPGNACWYVGTLGRDTAWPQPEAMGWIPQHDPSPATRTALGKPELTRTSFAV